jgi:hypothetical protein
MGTDFVASPILPIGYSPFVRDGVNTRDVPTGPRPFRIRAAAHGIGRTPSK